MSNPFGVVGHKKATPSADDLLSIKLLCDIDNSFEPLKEESVVYLKSAMKMLQASPFLRNRLGGDGIQQASVLAELVKQRGDTLNFQNHIDNMSRQLLNRELQKFNMTGQKPLKVPMWDENGVLNEEQLILIGADRSKDKLTEISVYPN